MTDSSTSGAPGPAPSGRPRWRDPAVLVVIIAALIGVAGAIAGGLVAASSSDRHSSSGDQQGGSPIVSPSPGSTTPTGTVTAPSADWSRSWGPTTLRLSQYFDLDGTAPQPAVGSEWDLTGNTTIPSGNGPLGSYITVNPWPGSASALAVWTSSRPPTPSQCEQLATTQADPNKGTLAKAGQTLCVQTSQRNVAIVTVDSVGQVPQYSNDPIYIEVTVTVYTPPGAN